jgi:lipopolysaccharide transport system permease protein
MTMAMAQYVSLLIYKARAELLSEAQRTYIGYLWWVFDPVMQMAVYFVVFSIFLRRGGPDFVPFLLVGLVSWRWFGATITPGANAVLGGKGLMLQVYLPKALFPTVIFLVNTFKFIFVLILLLVFLWIYGYRPSQTYLALFPVLFCQGLLTLGLTYVFSSFVPFAPDIRILLENVLRGVFFLSGIFYAGSTLSPAAQTYFYLNPMAVLIESFRDILLNDVWPRWDRLAWVFLLGAAIAWIGRFSLRRLDRVYPKVVR